MSRAGRRPAKPDDLPPAPAAAEVPLEVQELVERHASADRVYVACKTHIVARYPPLWPPESIGAAIAEQWIQNVLERLAQQRAAVQRSRIADAAALAGGGVARVGAVLESAVDGDAAR